MTIHQGQGPIAAEQLRRVFRGKIIAAGGFEPETAETTIENGVADAVAFGRHFVANPDLPLRIQEGLALTPYDRDTSIPSTRSAITTTASSANWRPASPGRTCKGHALDASAFRACRLYC